MAVPAVTIKYDSHPARRNVRFGNNQMDKLDLPIPGSEVLARISHVSLVSRKLDRLINAKNSGPRQSQSQ